jgi:hypothetical protein
MYVQSLARAFRQAKTRVLAIKLDIKKSFDFVSWEILLDLLEKLGFGHRWIDWISMLLSPATTRFLTNGLFLEILKNLVTTRICGID